MPTPNPSVPRPLLRSLMLIGVALAVLTGITDTGSTIYGLQHPDKYPGFYETNVHAQWFMAHFGSTLGLILHKALTLPALLLAAAAVSKTLGHLAKSPRCDLAFGCALAAWGVAIYQGWATVQNLMLLSP